MTFATHSTAKSLTTEVLNEPFSQRINPIDAYLNTHAQAGQFSGSVAIAHPKEGTITRSYGQANREHEVPNHAQTKFRIGSLTKQFTAVSILQLQERGLLNVQSPLSAYLPNYPQGKKITVHHLLTHTSGISEYIDPEAFPDFLEWMQRPTTLSQLTNRFKERPLEFSPGEKFKYCNSGYVLLAQIIEVVSQQSYADYLQTNVLDPLALRNTGHEVPLAVIPHLAQGYLPLGDNIYLQASPFDLSIAQGAGGLYSTVEDLAQWNQWLYSEVADQSILSRAARETMFTPAVPINLEESSDTCYGYGLALDTHLERSRIHHLGGLSGFASALAYYPTEKLTVVVLSNLETAVVRQVGEGLAAIVLGIS
ncbi:MAG: beta-lactamase family protein [Phormidesmis sp. RL_2_1]|nr:beta-lactamase family protein [Phormidesmis sp. RL_2_1]